VDGGVLVLLVGGGHRGSEKEEMLFTFEMSMYRYGGVELINVSAPLICMGQKH